MRKWLRRLLPWLISAAVVAAVLQKYRLADILREMREGNTLAMAPIALASPLVYLFILVYCDREVFRGCLPDPPRYFEIFRGKAAASVLLVVGYFVGSGGYGVWLARRTRAGAALATGMILYIMTSDLVAVCLIGAAAIGFGGAPAPRWLLWGTLGIAALQLGFIGIGPLELLGPTPPLFRPWRDVRRLRGLAQILGRCLNIFVAVASTWAAARAFGLAIPFGAMASFMPIILLVLSLPVNVAGLGAVQGAWLLFLPWASGPKILAFSTLYYALVGVATVARGLPFVRRAVSDIDAGGPSVVESKVIQGGA